MKENSKSKYNEVIPIFFTVDDIYIPLLGVCLESIIDHISSENLYVVKILHTNIMEENKNKIMKYQRENFDIEFVDLNYYINQVKDKLYTRDYYTNTTYFRLFIPNLYPQYKKALYIDSDIILLDDIAKLYDIDMENNLIAGINDGAIQAIDVFKEYVEKVVGVRSWKKYFNAGVLLMNLDELRKYDFQEKFLYILGTNKFKVAQDQDYLNRICKGRVKIIDNYWDVMPVNKDAVKDESKIKLIHYNLCDKPWHGDVPFEKYFWHYAKKTEFYATIEEMKNNYSDEQKEKDKEVTKELINLAKKESSCVGDDRISGYEIYDPQIDDEIDEDIELQNGDNSELDDNGRSASRIAILNKIKEFEKEGKFDHDAENDPPTIPLEADDIDYLRKKGTSKIKAKVANALALSFFKKMIKNEKIVIKGINGVENIQKLDLDKGAIITCNHFNPFDVFTVESVIRKFTKQRMYKVIREGNYTNFPGFYGFLMRNCYTLPLSKNQSTMEKFVKSVSKILKNGDYILIYPEQSLWWNYRKPKPLKPGAFKLATQNDVPILPVFITMEDTDKLDDDGFPVQAYTVNIGEPIYPKENLNLKENTDYMKDKNFEIWKNIYENFYKTPLKYTTEEQETSEKE